MWGSCCESCKIKMSCPVCLMLSGLTTLLQCHKAKNLVPEAGGQPTRTVEAVLEIQVYP